MSEKVIPKQVILTCDRCGEKGVHSEHGPFRNGSKINREMWGYNAMGEGAGGHTKKDLCGDCDHDFMAGFMAEPDVCDHKRSMPVTDHNVIWCRDCGAIEHSPGRWQLPGHGLTWTNNSLE